MPKLLIIEPCLINFGDDRGGVDHAAGEIVDVPKDTANTLARNNRALYVVKTDDPDKTGRFTASEEMIKAGKEMVRAAKGREAAPSKSGNPE